MRIDEFPAVAFLAVTEIFDLNHHRDRVVVVDFKQVDVFTLDLGKNSLADDLLAEGRFVGRHVGHLIVRDLGVGHEVNELVGNLFGFFFGRQENALRAGARHHTIEEANRVGNHPRVEIILHAHGLAKQRLWIIERIKALGDGDLADLFEGRTVVGHVQALNQCHQRIRPAVAEHVHEVAALIFQLPLRRRAPIEGIAADQDSQIEVTAFDGVRRPSDAHDAARAAVVAVQYPIDFQAQLFRHVRRIVRTRLGRDRKSANLFFIDPGLL